MEYPYHLMLTPLEGERPPPTTRVAGRTNLSGDRTCTDRNIPQRRKPAVNSGVSDGGSGRVDDYGKNFGASPTRSPPRSFMLSSAFAGRI